MGMITRVRGRMRSFSITKLDPEDREEKIAETGEFEKKIRKIIAELDTYYYFRSETIDPRGMFGLGKTTVNKR